MAIEVKWCCGVRIEHVHATDIYLSDTMIIFVFEVWILNHDVIQTLFHHGILSKS